jgi:phage shock protein C
LTQRSTYIGVCAGIGRHYDWSARTVRIAFLVSRLLPGPQFLVHLAPWVAVPQEK